MHNISSIIFWSGGIFTWCDRRHLTSSVAWVERCHRKTTSSSYQWAVSPWQTIPDEKEKDELIKQVKEKEQKKEETASLTQTFYRLYSERQLVLTTSFTKLPTPVLANIHGKCFSLGKDIRICLLASHAWIKTLCGTCIKIIGPRL